MSDRRSNKRLYFSSVGDVLVRRAFLECPMMANEGVKSLVACADGFLRTAKS